MTETEYSNTTPKLNTLRNAIHTLEEEKVAQYEDQKNIFLSCEAGIKDITSTLNLSTSLYSEYIKETKIGVGKQANWDYKKSDIESEKYAENYSKYFAPKTNLDN